MSVPGARGVFEAADVQTQSGQPSLNQEGDRDEAEPCGTCPRAIYE